MKYDLLKRPTEITPHLRSVELNAAGDNAYSCYDGQGERVRKVVKKSGGVVEERRYMGNYEVYRKTVTGATILQRTTHNISDGSTTFCRMERRDTTASVLRYQYANHLGSASLELDAGGLLISYEEYRPFGTTSYRSGRTATEVSLKRYHYCGKERDEESGLYYYGARYYADWLARFVSVDPSAEKYSSWSPYNYCFNNPLNVIDPDGSDSVSVVDKENNTISITQTFYYDNTNEKFASLAITQDRTITGGPMDGTTFTAETTIASENGFGSQTWTVKDADGNEWMVSYQANFVGLEGADAVTEALKNDPTANKMEYVEGLGSAGKWDPNTNTLKIGNNRRWMGDDRGTTLIHEMGHSWGLPHENAMSGSPIYGQSDNGKSSTATNGIMSYSGSREVKTHEMQYGANRILDAVGKSTDNVVKIHVVGSQVRQHKIMK